MPELALRCASCGAPLRAPREVRRVACATCGAGLEVVTEGGAAYTAIDPDFGAGEAEVSAESADARRPPGRAASTAAGAVTAAAGAGWAALGAGAGAWAWATAGAVVAAVGLAAAARAQWGRGHRRTAARISS